MVCKDVSAETMYDVLHDTEYRKKWDKNVIETFDIGRLTVNADVGYYSCMLHARTHAHSWKCAIAFYIPSLKILQICEKKWNMIISYNSYGGI